MNNITRWFFQNSEYFTKWSTPKSATNKWHCIPVRSHIKTWLSRWFFHTKILFPRKRRESPWHSCRVYRLSQSLRLDATWRHQKLLEILGAPIQIVAWTMKIYRKFKVMIKVGDEEFAIPYGCGVKQEISEAPILFTGTIQLSAIEISIKFEK